MDLRAGADQRPVPGVHDEGPVRAPLPGQQPPEERQRVGPPEARDLALEGPPDDEVRALALPDLVLDDPPDDPGVLLVRHVEGAALDPHLAHRQPVQHLGERQLVRLLGDQHGQRSPVVAHIEAALGDLPERHQGERGLFTDRETGEPVRFPHPADQHLDGVLVVAGVRLRSSANGGQPSLRSRSMTASVR